MIYCKLYCDLSISNPGWGSGSESTDLYQVHLELVAQSDCDNALDPYDEDVMICAGDVENGGRDTCQVGRYQASVVLSAERSS